MPRKPDDRQLHLMLDECPEVFLDVEVRFEVVDAAFRRTHLALSDRKQLKDKDREKAMAGYRTGFAGDMFGPSGDAILISKTGALIKGVKVCASADRDFVRLVIRNLPQETLRKSGVKSQRSDMLRHPDFVPPIRPDPGVPLREFVDAINAGVDPRYPRVRKVYLTKQRADLMLLATRRRMTPSARRIIDGMILDLKAGLWDATADPVICTAALEIMDGWMRAVAVSESGVRMPVILVENAHPGFAVTYGSGMKTNLGDRLYALGYNQPWAIEATLKRMGWWIYGDTNARQSLGQLCKTLDDHRDIVNSVKPTYPARTAMYPRVAVMLHYCLTGVDPVGTAAFFNAFRATFLASLGRGGKSAKAGSHPVARSLLERLGEVGCDKHRGPEHDIPRIRYILQAWKAFREGRDRVSFRDGSAMPDLPIPRRD